MTDITMPRLSDSMEEAIILTWLKADGDTIAAGDELVEIETDKATMTYESPEGGTLTIVVSEGTTIAVGEPIARVSAGAPASSDAPPASSPSAAEPASAAPNVPVLPVSASPSSPPTGGTSTSTNGAGGTAGKARSTPLARRVAAAHGVDLQAVTGTGPNGRITRADVATSASLDLPSPVPAAAPPNAPAADAAPPAPRANAAPGDTTGAKGTSTRQEPTRVQQVIARRMAEAMATVPHFQVQTEARMDALLALRAQLKAASDRPPSVNDFVVKAAALALREFPLVNGSYKQDGFELHSRVNVGVAVATADALVVPTVTDADTRSLGAIALEVRRLAVAVREGTITPPELAGATFTVSNLGMYGMTAITSVINAPQAAILGVGAARDVLGREDGEIVDRKLMTMTLSCDHRIVYGAEAAQFLSRIRDLLEQPLLLAF